MSAVAGTAAHRAYARERVGEGEIWHAVNRDDWPNFRGACGHTWTEAYVIVRDDAPPPGVVCLGCVGALARPA